MEATSESAQHQWDDHLDGISRECQTPQKFMIDLACNLLLHYLEELKTDASEYKRMKELINRLLAKAR